MRSRLLSLAALLLSLAVGAHRMSAQELRGTVRDSASRLPVAGAVVMLVTASDGVVGRSITNQLGEFRVVLTDAASRVRVVRLGYRPRVIPMPAPSNGVVQLDLALVAIPITLESVRTVAAASCPERADAPAALALLEQARSGLLTTIVSRSVTPANMKRLLFERMMDGNSDRIVHQSVRIDSAVTTGSFGAVRSAADFVQQGFVQDSGGIRTFFAPDAETLLNDGFANGYCFRIMDAERGRPHQIGLGFTVADRRRERVDIEGALWVDTAARALMDIDFRYLGLDRRYDEFHAGGRVSFQAMPNGVVLVDRWNLRLVGARQDTMTVMVRRLESQQRPVQRLYAQEVGGELARATWPDGNSWKGSLGTLRVHAVTHAGRPASGAVVNLDDTKYRAVADAKGDLEITDVVPGPYQLVVIDPELSPLDITLETGLTLVAARDSIFHLGLDVPTAEDYAQHACVSDTHALGTAWILGRVTTPDGRPVAGAKWTVQRHVDVVGWVDIVEGGRTGSDGLFHYCKLALGTPIKVIAEHPGAPNASYVVELTEKLTVMQLELRPKD